MITPNKESTFLKSALSWIGSDRSLALQERLATAQQDELTIRTALGLVSLFALMCGVGLAYSQVLGLFVDSAPDVPIKYCTTLGLASLISIFFFLATWCWYFAILQGLRAECRCFILRIIETTYAADSRTVALDRQEAETFTEVTGFSGGRRIASEIRER